MILKASSLKIPLPIHAKANPRVAQQRKTFETVYSPVLGATIHPCLAKEEGEPPALEKFALLVTALQRIYVST